MDVRSGKDGGAGTGGGAVVDGGRSRLTAGGGIHRGTRPHASTDSTDVTTPPAWGTQIQRELEAVKGDVSNLRSSLLARLTAADSRAGGSRGSEGESAEAYLEISPDDDPQWQRAVRILDRIRADSGSAGAGQLAAVVSAAGAVDEEALLLIALAQCLTRRRQLSKPEMDSLCEIGNTSLERGLILQSEKELQAIRFGPLRAMARMRAYLHNAPMLESLRLLETQELKRLLGPEDGGRELDIKRFQKAVLHRVVVPMMAFSLYLTHACLVERLGDIAKARLAAEKILNALSETFGIEPRQMLEDRYQTSLIDLLSAMNWRASLAIPYFDTAETLRLKAEGLMATPRYVSETLSSLTDSPAASSLQASGMLARVSVPLLYSADRSELITPTYRIVKDEG